VPILGISIRKEEKKKKKGEKRKTRTLRGFGKEGKGRHQHKGDERESL